MNLQREELIGLLIITAVGVGLSLVGKLSQNEVQLLTWSYAAFAGSKGLSGMLPDRK
jgi:hypothetical protein